jgi:hypothetical protein
MVLASAWLWPHHMMDGMVTEGDHMTGQDRTPESGEGPVLLFYK